MIVGPIGWPKRDRFGSPFDRCSIARNVTPSRNIDPDPNLRDVLARLPHLTNQQISEVTPAAWDKAQQKSSKAKSPL